MRGDGVASHEQQQHAQFHDYHHLAFSCNYGAMKWLDALFDTDAKYNEVPESTRNVMLVGLASARELYPDKVKERKST